MRQKIVLQKISEEMRDLHRIEVKKNMFYRHGKRLETYIGFPTSLIKSIEDDVSIDIRFDFGVLSLSKEHPSAHLTLFDLKAMDRKIARERREKKKKREKELKRKIATDESNETMAA